MPSLGRVRKKLGVQEGVGWVCKSLVANPLTTVITYVISSRQIWWKRNIIIYFGTGKFFIKKSIFFLYACLSKNKEVLRLSRNLLIIYLFIELVHKKLNVRFKSHSCLARIYFGGGTTWPVNRVLENLKNYNSKKIL